MSATESYWAEVREVADGGLLIALAPIPAIGLLLIGLTMGWVAAFSIVAISSGIVAATGLWVIFISRWWERRKK